MSKIYSDFRAEPAILGSDTCLFPDIYTKQDSACKWTVALVPVQSYSQSVLINQITTDTYLNVYFINSLIT